MVKHVWSVLCERISQDQASNLISYLTCIEGMVVPGLPVVIPNLALGSRWHKEGDLEENLEFRLLLRLPDETERVLIAAKAVIKESDHRTNIVLGGSVFTQAGRHLLILQIKNESEWVTVSELPFDIKVAARSASEDPHKEQGLPPEPVGVAEKPAKRYEAKPARKIRFLKKIKGKT